MKNRDNIPESKVIWERGGLADKVRDLEAQVSDKSRYTPYLTEFGRQVGQWFLWLLGLIETAFQDLLETIQEVLTNWELDDLADVDASDPDDADVLTWDAATGNWVPGPSGGPHGHALDDLVDVDAPNPNNADVLTWSGASGKWIAAPGGGGGGTGTPGGGNGAIQYNDGGEFGGSGDLVWDTAAKEIRLSGDLVFGPTEEERLIQGPEGGSLVVRLSDSAGGTSLVVRNADDNYVFAVGSNGIIYLAMAVPFELQLPTYPPEWGPWPGHCWYDAESNALWLHDGNNWNQIGASSLAVRTTSTEAITTSEAQIIGANIPVGYFRVGTTLRFRAVGVATNTTTQSTWTVRIRVGAASLSGAVVASGTFLSGTTARTNAPVLIEGEMTVRSIGTSGSAIGNCMMVLLGGAAGGTGTTAASTINTQQINIAELTLVGASGSPSVTITNATIEVVN